MNNITFEATYNDYLLSKIYNRISNFSENSFYLEINKDKFEEIINREFKDLDSFEHIEYMYSKSTNNLEPFITKALISNEFAVTYDISNINELSLTDKDFDYEKNGIWNTSAFKFYYDCKHNEKIKNIIKELKGYIQTQDIKNRFYTIGADNGNFILNSEKVNTIDINLELNYGSKFLPVYEEICDALKTQYKGLILFFGDSGTGKTYFLRHLISLLCNDKTIIYVPAYMIEQIANPEFISFIQRFKEAILILEDAEHALQARSEEYGAQIVSNLLNITDGLLNDATKIQVIATFNMDKKNIDKALLRPGRLLKEWKFDKLSIDESKAVAKYLNKNIDITTSMTLAEIYSGKTQVKKTKKRIGISED